MLILEQGRIQQKISDLDKQLRVYENEIHAEEAFQAQGLSGGLIGVDPNLVNLRSGSRGNTQGQAGGALDLGRELLLIRQKIAQFESYSRDSNHPDLQAVAVPGSSRFSASWAVAQRTVPKGHLFPPSSHESHLLTKLRRCR